jgi:hypothetical protein
MEHRILASSPFAMCIWYWGVLWQNATHIPVEKVWVVGESLCVNSVVVQNDGTIVFKTTTNTANDEVDAPSVCKSTTGIEVFDREFTNNSKTKEATNLSSCSIVSPVKV